MRQWTICQWTMRGHEISSGFVLTWPIANDGVMDKRAVRFGEEPILLGADISWILDDSLKCAAKDGILLVQAKISHDL